MGALGGLSGAFGSYGRQEPPSLDLSLEVLLATLPEPIEVLLVFTKAADPDVLHGRDGGGPSSPGEYFSVSKRLEGLVHKGMGCLCSPDESERYGGDTYGGETLGIVFTR